MCVVALCVVCVVWCVCLCVLCVVCCRCCECVVRCVLFASYFSCVEFLYVLCVVGVASLCVGKGLLWGALRVLCVVCCPSCVTFFVGVLRVDCALRDTLCVL